MSFVKVNHVSRTGPRTPIDLARFQFQPPPWYTVHDCCCDYSRERLIGKGKDCRHAWNSFNNFMRYVDPKQDVTTLATGQIEDYGDARVAEGVTLVTVRRELTFVAAAIHNAHRRNRIKVVPYIELPDAQSAGRIPLTEAQFREVMTKPMSKRLRRFYWTAYFTGHRAQAIEQLEWSRVLWDKDIIDFNVPGRAVTNKRRCADFPIVPEFRRSLEQWHAAREDEFVIGAGPSTYNEAAYVVRELCGFTDPRLVPRHCMRSMFATEMFERGGKDVNPEVIGHLLADHPDTLRKAYVKFKQSTLQAAAMLRTREPA